MNLGRINPNRYLTLSLTFLIASCCALNYSFSIISPLLKHTFGSQEQVNVIGSVGNVFQFVSLPAGIVYERYKEKRTLFIGFLVLFIGYSGLYHELSKENEEDVSFASICIFYAIASSSQPFLDAAGFLTNIFNFETAHVEIIGIGKGFNALGSSLWSSFYIGFFHDHDRNSTNYQEIEDQGRVDYLFFIVIMSVVFTLLPLPFIARVSQEKRHVAVNPRVLLFITGFIALFALYLAGISLFSHGGANKNFITFLVVVMILLLIVLLVFTVYFGTTPEDGPIVSITTTENESEILMSNAEGEMSNEEGVVIVKSPASLISALRHMELWLLFFIILIIDGCGLSLLNNLAQIHESYSLGTQSASGAALSSLYAVFNCYGRLGGSRLVVQNFDASNLLVYSSIILSIAMFITATGSDGLLLVTTAATGTVYGALWVFFPSVLKQIYTESDEIGKLYTFLASAPAISSYLMATKLTGVLYDIEQEKQCVDATGKCQCLGKECFSKAFFILGFLALVAALLSSILRYLVKRKLGN
jgi:hypothetical protein